MGEHLFPVGWLSFSTAAAAVAVEHVVVSACVPVPFLQVRLTGLSFSLLANDQ